MAEDDDTPHAESLLPYDDWAEDALRGVAVRALQHTEREGLPGGHHFYITFRTDYPGVEIPDRLRAQYPEEMTIVLQHQFHDLHVDETQTRFSVSLAFSGIPSKLSIPFAALTGFADPEVRFGLRFHVDMPEHSDIELPGELEESAPQGEAEIVSLDAFRKKTPPKE